MVGTAISLATIGTVLTALITGLVAVWLFDLSTLEGLLIGSAVAATDSAAIFAVLRGSRLKRRLARALEGESGMNDPVALLLVTGFIDWIQMSDYGANDMAAILVGKLALGLAFGIALGFGARWCFRNLDLPSPGLYPGRLDRHRRPRLRRPRARPRIRLPLGVHRRAHSRHGSGAGAADHDRVPPGALVDGADLAVRPARTAGLPSGLGEVAGEGLLLSAALIFVARPSPPSWPAPWRRSTIASG